MMRVALVASLVSPLKAREANGPHAVIVDLGHGLAERGHEVTVYAAEGSRLEGLRLVTVPVPEAARAAALRADRAPGPRAVAALDRAFARLFDAIRSDAPDAVSQHAFDAGALRLAAGLPVMHILHLPPIDDRVVAAARATADPLVAVSLAGQRAWQDAIGGKVGLIRNGVPAPQPAAGTVQPIALVAGRISPEKGTDAAIRVARRAGLRVLVIGDAYDAEYHARAVAPLLHPGEWIGPVTRPELSGIMARCRLLLMPVRWEEAFGLVAAEAQMAGCPVVAYRRGALPEVVADGVGGFLVEPDEEDALLAAVRRAGELDRGRVRASALGRLGMDRMLDGHERALAAVAAARRPARVGGGWPSAA